MQESVDPAVDTVAEWSKAPGSGPGSKERGFKSHRCHGPSVFLRPPFQAKLEKGNYTLIRLLLYPDKQLTNQERYGSQRIILVKMMLMLI